MRQFVLAVAATTLLSAPAISQQPSPQPSPKDKGKSTPSFNDDDLDRLAGRKPGEPKPPAPPVPAAAPGGNESSEGGEGSSGRYSGQGVEGEASPEPADWAERAAALRSALAAAEETLKGMEERAQALLWQYLQSTDTNEIMSLKAEQQEILDQIPDAKKAVEDAQKALSDFEREAARAGVPPGEIREKKTP